MTSPTDCANQEKMKHITELATNKGSMKDDARQPTQPSGTEPKRAEQISTLGASEEASEEAAAVNDLPKNSRHQNKPQELSPKTQPSNRPDEEETAPEINDVLRDIIKLKNSHLAKSKFLPNQ